MADSSHGGNGFLISKRRHAPAGVLLLTPSRDLGGGIERYVTGLIDAVTRRGIPCQRLDLATSSRPAGILGKLRFAAKAWRTIAAAREPVRVVAAHRDLSPILPLFSWLPRYRGAVIVVHGREAWTDGHAWGNAILRSRAVQVLAVSNYTRTVLTAAGVRSRVLPPGLSRDWFDVLSHAEPAEHDGIDIMTAFRLTDWRDKGLETIIGAMRLLPRQDLRLSVCGTGTPPADLVATIEAEPCARLFANLSDRDFAAKLASADVFVLATRTRAGRLASGEGFGMVLLEAQVTGTPVIAPASGGSADAFQPGRTGLTPDDESAEELAVQLGRLLDDPERLAGMGRAAARWSRSRFEPDAYAALVAGALFG